MEIRETISNDLDQLHVSFFFLELIYILRFFKSSTAFLADFVIITNLNGKYFFSNKMPETMYRIKISKYKKVLIIIEKSYAKKY